MLKYCLKRLAIMIPILIGVMIIVFTINYISPADPVVSILGASATEESMAALRSELGLDQSYSVQLFNYVRKIVTQFDFGNSYVYGTSVTGMIAEKFPVTAKLGLITLAWSVLLGVALGVVSAIKQYSVLDYCTTTVALFGASMPAFWLGLMLMILFSLKLGWLPASGIETWKHFIMPSVCIGVTPVVQTMRITRSSMLEVIRQDYIGTIRAKGMSERVVIWRHALKNALIPVITVVGFQIGLVLGGVMVVEAIFSIPGMGMLMQNAILNKDYIVIQGCVLFCAFITCAATLAVDLLYSFVDPRIKGQYVRKKTTRKNNEQRAEL